MSLKSIRLKKGFTQAQVADRLGIDTSAYCLIENEKRGLTVSRAVEIADFFGCSLAELLEKEEPHGEAETSAAQS